MSAPCPATLAGGPLICTREVHADLGHVFESTSGVDDRHQKGDDE